MSALEASICEALGIDTSQICANNTTLYLALKCVDGGYKLVGVEAPSGNCNAPPPSPPAS